MSRGSSRSRNVAISPLLCVPLQRDLKPQNLLVTSNWTVKVGAGEGCRGMEGVGGGRRGHGKAGRGWRERRRRSMEGTASCAHARTHTPPSRPPLPLHTPCPCPFPFPDPLSTVPVLHSTPPLHNQVGDFGLSVHRTKSLITKSIETTEHYMVSRARPRAHPHTLLRAHQANTFVWG